jgi:hypothetical protein
MDWTTERKEQGNMGVRAIKARIQCDGPTLHHLWRTHKVFNDRLKSLLGKLFAMRRGELGTNPEHRKACKVWMEFILSRPAKDAVYLLNAVSITGWKPATALKMLTAKPPKDPAELRKFEKRMTDLAAAIKTRTRWPARFDLPAPTTRRRRVHERSRGIVGNLAQGTRRMAQEQSHMGGR